ncbi:MAG: hypothetical protein E7043_00155 [Lentisphaerae bacterium]|nr:hypothetical protein [Lentisphaerota bacterium]
MSFRSFCGSLIRRLPCGDRWCMALAAFSGNIQYAVSMYFNSTGSRILSDDEIADVFSGLDEQSIELARRFMHRQFQAPVDGVLIYPKNFYLSEEKEEYEKIHQEYLKSLRKYGFQKNKVGPESVYYHHGLRFIPESGKNYIKGKLFADVGGWWGDSTLVFQKYMPKKTLIFEPVAQNRKKLLKILSRNHVNPETFELLPFGLSDSKSTSDGMEFCSLDDIADKYTEPFGVLKADIEGAGLRFINGAKAVIMRDRPFLSIAIYHNQDEFVGIYQTLKSWNINYHYEIKFLHPFMSHGECTLIAYPAEWECEK